jgi:hypothetical protein
MKKPKKTLPPELAVPVRPEASRALSEVPNFEKSLRSSHN